MNYSQIKKNPDGTLAVGPISQVPDITKPGIEELSAMFLGPRAENHALLDRLISEALEHLYQYRRDYLPGDPATISASIQASSEYQQSVAQMGSAYREYVDFLKRYATPFFSLRYQGHMLWDNTLPAIAGYFAAMLHNPNNVSLQASTSTTPLAMLVGWDLCQMVGYRFRPGLEPWSHMTADGTLANIEATWAMREARFLPMSLRAALRSDHKTGRTLAPAGTIEVTLCTGERRRLLEASSWQLLNVPLDESLALPRRVAALCDLDDPTDVWNMLVPFACNSLGVAALFEQPGEQVAAPVIVTPSTKHYCWPKAAAISGLGSSHLLNVHV